MDRSQRNTGQKIAQAAQDFELQSTNRAREWVTVFMNEATVVVALHGSLTAQEVELVSTSAGFAQFLEDQKQLFAAPLLLEKVKAISGIVVRDTAVELLPRWGSVVILMTTDKVGVAFPFSPDRVARFTAPIPGKSRQPWPQQSRRKRAAKLGAWPTGI